MQPSSGARLSLLVFAIVLACAVGCVGPRRSFSLADQTNGNGDTASPADQTTPLDGSSAFDLADSTVDANEEPDSGDTTGPDALIDQVSAADLSWAPVGSTLVPASRVAGVTIYSYQLARPPFAFVEMDDRLIHLSSDGGAVRLFSTKLAGGTTQLSYSANPIGRVWDFQLIGNEVFALSDNLSSQIRGIYHVLAWGQNGQHVTAPAVVAGFLEVQRFDVADLSRLVFSAKTDSTGLVGLYLIRTQGDGLKNLSPGDAVFRDTSTLADRLLYRVLPQASGVLYISDPKVDGLKRLMQVYGLLTATPIVREIVPVGSDNVEVLDFFPVQSQDRVVFLASDPLANALWLESAELSIAKSHRISKNIPLQRTVGSYTLALNDTAILYVVATSETQSAIYRSPVTVSSDELTRLTPTSSAAIDRIISFCVDASGRYLTYLRELVDRTLVVTLDLQSGEETVLFDDFLTDDHAIKLVGSGYDAYVVTANDQGLGRRLHYVHVSSNTNRPLTPALGAGSDALFGVRDFVVGPDSLGVAIVGEFRERGTVDVVVSSTVETPAWQIVTPTSQANVAATINALAFHPDGKRLLFAADYLEASRFDLYVVTLTP